MSAIDILILTYVLLNVGALFMIICVDHDEINPSFVNPIVIYNEIRVNWFGAILLSIVANICLPSCAIPYWIYKLCTVGRK